MKTVHHATTATRLAPATAGGHRPGRRAPPTPTSTRARGTCRRRDVTSLSVETVSAAASRSTATSTAPGRARVADVHPPRRRRSPRRGSSGRDNEGELDLETWRSNTAGTDTFKLSVRPAGRQRRLRDRSPSADSAWSPGQAVRKLTATRPPPMSEASHTTVPPDSAAVLATIDRPSPVDPAPLSPRPASRALGQARPAILHGARPARRWRSARCVRRRPPAVCVKTLSSSTSTSASRSARLIRSSGPVLGELQRERSALVLGERLPVAYAAGEHRHRVVCGSSPSRSDRRASRTTRPPSPGARRGRRRGDAQVRVGDGLDPQPERRDRGAQPVGQVGDRLPLPRQQHLDAIHQPVRSRRPAPGPPAAR